MDGSTNFQVGHMNDDTVYYRVSSSTVETSYTLGYTGWYHIVTTLDGGTRHIYVDGEEKSNSSGGITGDATFSSIGGGYTTTTYTGDGIIDEVRFSNKARSAAWVSTDYNNQNSPSTFYSVGEEETANIEPDCNIWQVDGYDFNAALPSFSYPSDGNLTIAFSVTDAEQDDLNFNMWYGLTRGLKTNLIISDINLSTDAGYGNCDTNVKTGMVCGWDWNISGIADTNYWITIELNDGSDSNTAQAERSFRVNPGGNKIPDCNVLQVEGNDFNAALPSFSYTHDGNLTIKFSAADEDGDDLSFSMWHGTSRGGKTGLIISDVNLSTDAGYGNCDSNSKITGMYCSWDWNISGIADNNYWITVEIGDGSDTNTAGSERSFRVNPAAVIPNTTRMDVNVTHIDGNPDDSELPSFTYTGDGNLTIDFNFATDTNFNASGPHTADINYSTTFTRGSGTSIITGLAIDGNYCQTNFLRDWTGPGTDENLVGYWKFDAQEDDYNTLRAFDYSGNENHGQYLNGADNNAAGRWDTNAFFGDGINDYVNVGDDSSLDITDQLTITAWIKPNASNAYDYVGIVQRQQGSNENVDSYLLGFNSDYKLHFGTNGGNIQSTQTTWNNGQWYHIAATYTSSGPSGDLYINGVKEVLSVDSLDSMAGGANDVLIGAYLTAVGPDYFNGLIEEVKIYDRVLTANEIGLDYNLSARNHRKCSYDWNISGIADDNYYALINTKDGTGNEDFNSSDNNFRVNPPGADLSFAMFLPASGCSEGEGSFAGNSSGTCDKCYFENSGLQDENQVACQGQVDSAAGPSFFYFDNQSTSSTDLDWKMDLNSALPAYLKLKMSQAHDGWEAICSGNPTSGCVDVNATENARIGSSISVSVDLNGWAWADFIGASASTVDRNATHYSSES